MKIFISYKQTGVNKNELDIKLTYLKDKLMFLCSSSYCLWTDDKPNFYDKRILLDKIYNKILNSQLIIFLIDSDNKSEGQLLELGISYGLGKKIILLVKNNIKDNYYLSYATTKNVVYYNKLEDLDFKKILNNY